MKKLIIICNGKEIYKCKDTEKSVYYTVESRNTIDFVDDLPSALAIAMG